jgi:hypothetical protein
MLRGLSGGPVQRDAEDVRDEIPLDTTHRKAKLTLG